MAFFKVARAPIIRISSSDPQKQAGFAKKAGSNLIDPDYLSEMSRKYAISKNAADYGYVVVRAVTSDIPNMNGDCFRASELLRPHIEAKCRVYQTFCYAPHHVNHKSEDPQGARGFVVDAHYNTVDDPDYHFVECVVALDKKKDPHWASAILEGRLDNFSMGCLAEYTICSICNNKATSPRELCAHVRDSRMQRINGKLAYEECYGVTFKELSGVDRGADRSARTRAVLSPKTMPIAPSTAPGRISVASINLERF